MSLNPTLNMANYMLCMLFNMHTRENKQKTTNRVLFDLPMLEFTKIREEATEGGSESNRVPKDTNPEASLTPVWSLRKHFGVGGGGGPGHGAYGILLPPPGINRNAPCTGRTGSKPPRKSFSVGHNTYLFTWFP